MQKRKDDVGDICRRGSPSHMCHIVQTNLKLFINTDFRR